MSNNALYNLQQDAIVLLKQLIACPSFSKEEHGTATLIENFLKDKGVKTYRYLNNVWALNQQYLAGRPTILLNSHHDTVKPNKGYTLDPFSPVVKDEKLFGLGSNDAGGCLVSLIATFLHFYEAQDLQYNIVLAATAEEEISGKNGIEGLLQSEEFLRSIGNHESNRFDNWSAIVGEPTQMQLAVAEKGLMVLDCMAHGKAGHAARNEVENSIYKAMKDIEWVSAFQFPKVSQFLGPVKMSVTSIETENKAHNVVPSQCSFIIDVRLNELYTMQEVQDIIREHVLSEFKPRSTRMRSSSIALDHPLVKAGLALGKTPYGSPTTSDKALMPFGALKMGPGDSARSHTADEYIYVHEIESGIDLYIQLLNQVVR